MDIALITGSSGLIGSEAVEYFANKGFNIIGIDNDMRRYFFGDEASTAWNTQNLKKSVSGFIHKDIDIRNYKKLERLFDKYNKDIKLIIHTAAQPSHDWQPGPENFQYSSELAAFIRKQFGDYFGIAVAGFPEGHLLCKDLDQDAQYLKIKIDSGADFVITQLFFDNKDYFEYLKRLGKIGVTVRVIPGILPITDYEKLQRFCNLCGAIITDEVKSIFEPIQNDPQACQQAGIEFAIKQCRELLDGGAPGLHFYCLNKLSPVDKILEAVRI